VGGVGVGLQGGGRGGGGGDGGMGRGIGGGVVVQLGVGLCDGVDLGGGNLFLYLQQLQLRPLPEHQLQGNRPLHLLLSNWIRYTIHCLWGWSTMRAK
jgi:hypothetical protein